MAVLAVTGGGWWSAAVVAPQRDEGLYAEIQTSKGLIVARLEYEKTPLAVSSFVGLAEGTIENEAFDAGEPYYDGSSFHRVVPGHVIQGGVPDARRTSARGPGYTYPNEIHADLSHDHAGALGVANGGPHTNAAQFYITLGDRSYLDGDYIVFGEVVEGMAVVEEIVQGDEIESVRIVRVGAAAEAFHPDTESFRELVQRAERRVERDKIDRGLLEAEYLAMNYPGAWSVSQTGLRYLVALPGRGAALADGDRVTIRYVATALLYSGHVIGVRGPLFDELRYGGAAGDGTPAELDGEVDGFAYELGVTEITPGFDEAVRDMRRGEQRLVIVPAGLAYGSRGFYGPDIRGHRRLVIPPDTTIIYGIEVRAP